MIRVKKVILRNTGILLKDKKSLEEFRGELGSLLDIDVSQITFTHDELDGTLVEDDPCLKTIKQLKGCQCQTNDIEKHQPVS